MSHPESYQPPLDRTPTGEELALARAWLTGHIRSELIAAAEDELLNHHLDTIVLRHPDGRTYTHRVERDDEAQRVDEAVWSAGENMDLDRMAEQFVRELDRQGWLNDPASVRQVTFEIQPQPEIPPSGTATAA